MPIADRATFEDGRQLATGVEHVLVNGEVVLRVRGTGAISEQQRNRLGHIVGLKGPGSKLSCRRQRIGAIIRAWPLY